MAEADVIIVHTFEQAAAALDAAEELSLPITLQSAPDAILYAGSLYLLHMFEQAQACFPKVPARFILDCGETGAEAVGAMQLGHRVLRSSAPEELRAKLADIASQCGAELVNGPYRQLDLLNEHDPKAACKTWLAGHAKD